MMWLYIDLVHTVNNEACDSNAL